MLILHLLRINHQILVVHQANQANQIKDQIWHQNQQQNHQYHQITIIIYFHHQIKMVINKMNNKIMVIRIRKY